MYLLICYHYFNGVTAKNANSKLMVRKHQRNSNRKIFYKITTSTPQKHPGQKDMKRMN